MAKKKPAEVAAEVDSNLMTSVLAEIEANYGAGIVRTGQDLVDSPRHVISFSPSLDYALGGGAPEGSWISVAGPEKIGKTVSLLSFAAQCQKPENGSRQVMYLSVEHRLKDRDLLGIKGLKREAPHFYFVESTKGKILSSVDFLNIGQAFLKSVPGGLLIIDSISALCNPKLLSDGIGSSSFGSGNILVGQFCDLMAPVVKTNLGIVAGVVQLYTNTSGYGAKFSEKAAKKWQYQADIQLLCKYAEAWTATGDDSDQLGKLIHWVIKTSAIGKPGGADSYLRFGVGIDRTMELFIIAHGIGLISGKGWYTFEFLASKPELADGVAEVKVQGKENAVGLLAAHPEWEEELYKQVREIVQGVPTLAS